MSDINQKYEEIIREAIENVSRGGPAAYLSVPSYCRTNYSIDLLKVSNIFNVSASWLSVDYSGRLIIKNPQTIEPAPVVQSFADQVRNWS